MLSLPAILILALACTATVLPWGRGRLPILMYHKVRPGPADGLTVPLAVFREQMKTLSQAGYESIS
ncbi:MAG TPA: polysaccharide deacetylase, partial [Phycisphaerales bacterium]|nr:polysaccharide deacetylase [Phycisphaerales bacterium]